MQTSKQPINYIILNILNMKLIKTSFHLIKTVDEI